jgi:putative transcriptional regulator
MPTHHPEDSLLLEYANGALPQSIALVVATHVGGCAQCQASSGGFEAVGGACLDDIAPVEMSADALASLFALLDGDPVFETPVARVAGVPSPLNEFMTVGFDAVPWKGRDGRIQTFDLDVSDRRTFLLRIPAGGKSPVHTHRGQEYTLVVDGAFIDDSGEYHEGDFVVTDDSVKHAPQVLGERACICLAVLESPVKLSGPLGWLINPFLN